MISAKVKGGEPSAVLSRYARARVTVITSGGFTRVHRDRRAHSAAPVWTPVTRRVGP